MPNFYVGEQTDADFPFEVLVELAQGTGFRVFPALQRQIGRPREPDGEPVGEGMATAEQYHAPAAAARLNPTDVPLSKLAAPRLRCLYSVGLKGAVGDGARDRA